MALAVNESNANYEMESKFQPRCSVYGRLPFIYTIVFTVHAHHWLYKLS